MHNKFVLSQTGRRIRLQTFFLREHSVSLSFSIRHPVVAAAETMTFSLFYFYLDSVSAAFYTVTANRVSRQLDNKSNTANYTVSPVMLTAWDLLAT